MSDIETSEPRAIGLDRETIEDIAEAMSRQSGYQPSASLDLIVKPFGGEVLVRDYFATGRTGSIEIDGRNDFEVFVPTHTSPAQDRYTVAHELGHYVLHYLWRSRTEKMGRLTAHRTGGQTRAEDEANWFASAFLMPKSRIAPLAEKGASPGEIAAQFAVSPAAAMHRLNRLKAQGAVSDQPVSVVAG